jgi:hypothetical protein
LYDDDYPSLSLVQNYDGYWCIRVLYDDDVAAAADDDDYP